MNPPYLGSRPIGRRTLVLGTGALVLGLAGCNASAESDSTPQGSSSAAQGFSWTDARGQAIDLPTVPKVVVAQSSAAASLLDAGLKIAGVYGELTETDGKLDYQAGNIDVSQVTVLGKTYGEFKVEAYAAMNPELLIDMSFDNKTLWYVPVEAASKIEALAPTLGIKALNLGLVEIIEEFMDLAAKLGADTTAPAVVDAKAAFEQATEKIKAAVAAQPDLTVLAASPSSNTMYIANPAQHSDLALLKSLGVKFVDYQGKAEEYFAEISYEQLDKYSADVVLSDARNYAEKDKVDAQATWKALAAVKGGQVYDWLPAAPFSYAAYVSILEGYAEALSGAKRLV
jgi:iron complex transport system substrate-binding protein